MSQFQHENRAENVECQIRNPILQRPNLEDSRTSEAFECSQASQPRRYIVKPSRLQRTGPGFDGEGMDSAQECCSSGTGPFRSPFENLHRQIAAFRVLPHVRQCGLASGASSRICAAD